MHYNEATPSYNDRRYGKPWMARVNASLTRDFEFIDWNGRPGSAGEFDFSAEPGTILAYGQKDIRKGRGGVDGYQICMPDGAMPGISDSAALKVLKLPIADRPAAYAAIVIAAAETRIAEIPAAKAAEEYYAAKAAEDRALIARYRAFLPAVPAIAPYQGEPGLEAPAEDSTYA